MNLDKLVEGIEKSCTLIGSRRWGGYKEDSDYDYVILEEHSEELISYFNRVNINIEANSKYNGSRMYNTKSYKVNINNREFNFIVYSNDKIDMIERLNILMDSLKTGYENIFDNRESRIHFCEAIMVYLMNDMGYVKEREERYNRDIKEIKNDDLLPLFMRDKSFLDM